MSSTKAYEPGYGLGSASLEEADLLTAEQIQERLLGVFRDPAYVPPVLPRVAVELLALSRKANVDIQEIATLLEQDALIAAKVLKRSTSALYSRGSPVRSLHDAVVRLGLTTVCDLFLEATMEARIFRAPGYEEPMDRLRRHSAATAHVARLICRQTSIYDEYAFLCGLLHDVGMVASLVALASARPRGESPPDLTVAWISICAAHGEIGELLCRLWQLPSDIAHVVAHHHGASRAGPVHPLCAAIAVAESLLADLDLALPGDGSADDISWALSALGLSQPVLASIAVQAKALIAAQEATEQAASRAAAPARREVPRTKEAALPAVTDEIWRNLLTGKAACAFEFLPHKLTLGRLSARVRRDPSSLFDSARELRSLFAETATAPTARRDVAKLAQLRNT